jgi:glycine oxidase
MIVIVGAGICGLAIAWRLAGRGRAVTVIDAGAAGRAASWAAAGMLAPQVEAEPGEETLLPLILESRAMWRDFAAELTRDSGHELGYRDQGTMVVALDRDDRAALEFRFDYLSRQGIGLEWLTGAQARRREPHLAPGVSAAMVSADDHQVDNRAVVAALRAVCVAKGVTLIEHDAVEEILVAGGRIAGVRLATRRIDAPIVVLAAGAWSRNIAGLPEDLRPPVRPLKGQMMAVRMDARAPLISHVVWGPGVYLVPRDDGRLLIGATVEEMGFDISMTAGGMFELLRAAWETLPGIYELPVIESWAGLRPASRDDAPILGATALDGLVMATGHHRNGILLAPITAATIARLILTGEVADAIRPFTLARFAGAAEAEAVPA